MLFWLVYFLVRRLSSEPEVADQTRRTSSTWCCSTR
jgi:hypothetical protein